MRTKEAIETLSRRVVFHEDFGFVNNETLIELDTLEANEIIELLKRGGKYEKMFKIFVQFIFNWRYPISHKVMRDKVRELRQRYLKEDEL